jgi:hypothetical protein
MGFDCAIFHTVLINEQSNNRQLIKSASWKSTMPESRRLLIHFETVLIFF